MTEILRTWAPHPSEDGQWHRMFQKLPPTVQPSEKWGGGDPFSEINSADNDSESASAHLEYWRWGQ